MPNNPSQGLNLGGQSSAYGDSFSSLNLFHGADAWIKYDANGNEVRGGVPLDDKGWVTEIPTLNGQPQTLVANIFYTKIVPAGDYIVEWTGEGKLTTYSNYEEIAPNKFRIKYNPDYSKGDDGVSLVMESTDPNNTGNYIRDIKVYQEKYSDLVAMGEHFDPKWFQQIDDFRVLRTHDWQGTNFSKVTGWTPNDVTADQAFWVKDGRGMPYELLVEVANQAKSDLWINIPHMATDDYIRKAAEYVKANLDPSLRVYVEYTNEYWTEGFDQHQYLIDKGKALFGNVEFANVEAYGARASEMTQIFKQVFGADQARLFPTATLPHEAFSTQEAITMLTTPDYVAKGGISPLDAGIKFLGTDGYLSWFNTDPATDARTDRWMTESDGGFGSARDFLINQLNTNLVPAWEKGRALADKYGLQLGIYEGGALLLNGDYKAPGDPKYTNFNENVQLSPQMKQVYEAELAAWQKVGSGPFAWYSDTGRWGPWGDYGLWNAPDFKPELRTEAIIAANQTVAPWWTGDTRPASTFDNGKYDAGTTGADAMTGTNLADRLYGLSGDDTLAGLDGDDILVGGAGNDSLNGGLGSDILVGGAGADKLSGGGGLDFASYQTSTLAVSVDLQQSKGLAGDALGDTLSGIRGLIGGAGNDALSGDDTANVINGRGGNDVMFGKGGDDTMIGGGHLLGGYDVLYGDAGVDTMSFAGVTSQVYADLLIGSPYGVGYVNSGSGFVHDSLFFAFENIIGGSGNDILQGDNNANILTGGDGADFMLGQGGSDTLIGGNGNDSLYGQGGNDRFVFDQGLDIATGGIGADTFYWNSMIQGADVVSDFSHAEGDKINLDHAVFGVPLAWGLILGTNFFVGAGAAPTQATASISFDTTSNILWYDIDGTGVSGRQAITFLSNGGGGITAGDILFV